MNKIRVNLFSVLFLLTFSFFLSCKKETESKETEETVIQGTVSILVDETLKPIIDDQVEVFESRYKAKINLIPKSENEIIMSFLNDSTRIAILSRDLNENERKHFETLKIIPRVTEIGSDAVTFIRNKKTKDTLIDMKEVLHFMKGEPQTHIKSMVFDNLNSSTYRYLNEKLKLTPSTTDAIFSFKTNEEVIKYVSENEGAVGIVGLNWLYRPSTVVSEYLKNIDVLSVKAIGGNNYFAPTQNNLAEGTYPLARNLFIINCQGSTGLGMGFASFVAGEVGQRIILKSGLLPIRTPGRKILIKTNSKTKE